MENKKGCPKCCQAATLMSATLVYAQQQWSPVTLVPLRRVELPVRGLTCIRVKPMHGNFSTCNDI
jgi:hypothetical protein